MRKLMIVKLMILALLVVFAPLVLAQEKNQAALDKKVRAFLDSQASKWHDMNVPEIDGKLLYDIIIKNKYTKALEIGTSTGHSSIWIAWALSKTGGKLITVEIDRWRHKTALENFKKAGLSAYIDARLADAHELVPKLPGPFDFVFSDADKDWYKNLSKLWRQSWSSGAATQHIMSRIAGEASSSDHAVMWNISKASKNFETTFNDDGAGVAISYKKSEK